MRLARLARTDFRNYSELTWQPRGRVAAIWGPNGSGKTNLLEAISLLVPGRGLRGARLGELARHGGRAWAVAGRFEAPEEGFDIGTGTPPGGPAERRVFRLDGAAPRSQAEIAARVAAVWLTPQMDRLFQEGASGRRRFLDRLVFALEPGHAREVSAHDSAMAQRNRLLAEGRADAAWLAGLEEAMARHAVAAAASRAALVGHLNAALAGGIAGAFPVARLGLVCPIAERLARDPALAVEDWLRAALATGRGADARAGSAGLGAHRADMALTDAVTGRPAGLASTGQQKALLVAVVLGHAALIAQARGAAPLLLLDEPAVHLDPDHRQALFAALASLPAQVFLTGTDRETFLPLRDLAEGLRTGEDTVRPDPEFHPA
ncbi:DNA replication/repair protein RecF [Rhodovastum atsumiense]|uniref:DNA replication and repair protein RecF n=1 Tax=Rhodovastum atsumiense TaxID=504468 RepID=A0A5M6IYA2_9PROT|nr:DNA replication/repair protein RecF [Rhodovastum atsumiense]KAA5613314.1 DNA replication/repair protein RecF [Rhodovastum atsumiense]